MMLAVYVIVIPLVFAGYVFGVIRLRRRIKRYVASLPPPKNGNEETPVIVMFMVVIVAAICLGLYGVGKSLGL